MRHKFEKKRTPSSGKNRAVRNMKSYFHNYLYPQPPQVDELQQVYKDHGIKLSYKQAKRLWDIFKDCNISTLIF
jgi:hypothetical protein